METLNVIETSGNSFELKDSNLYLRGPSACVIQGDCVKVLLKGERNRNTNYIIEIQDEMHIPSTIKNTAKLLRPAGLEVTEERSSIDLIDLGILKTASRTKILRKIIYPNWTWKKQEEKDGNIS